MSFAFTGERVASSILHPRLGHPAFTILQYVASKQCLPKDDHVKNIEFCEACPLGKSRRCLFHCLLLLLLVLGSLVHSDIWISPCYLIKGSKHYIVFVDDYSKYTWIFFKSFKHEAFDYFIKFKTMVEKLLSCPLKIL